MKAQEAIEQLEKTKAILAENQTKIESMELLVDELNELLARKEELLQKMETALLKKDKNIKNLQFDYDNLKHQLDLLQKRIFGKKSERFVAGAIDPKQTTLFGEVDYGQDAQTNELVEQEQKKEEKKVAQGKVKPTEGDSSPRMELPDHLEREVIIIDPEGIDLENATKIGEEVTEQLMVTPAVVKVRRIIRNKYTVESDTPAATNKIHIADLPDEVMAKMKCSLETIAWMLTSKYVDHLPVFRLEKVLARPGIRIKYNTLANWVQQGANRLNPLLEEFRKSILKSRYLMVDETPCKVIDHKNDKHVVQGYYWVYRDYDTGLVLYDFQPSRASSVPLSMLNGYEGYLQCDGYDGYNQLFEQNPTIHRMGCLAHARRKFDESRNSDKTRAEEALQLIQRLYAIEREATILNEGMEQQEREAATKAHREEKALPIWAEFEQWLHRHHAQTRPQSPIHKAISYTLKELKHLKTYLQAGYLRIDNNWVENSIRPTALGRKNYLYAGSPKTAQNSALIYSLVESCRIHNHNPYEYLLDILQRLPETNIQQLHTLLPNNWQKPPTTNPQSSNM
jgi:transposase